MILTIYNNLEWLTVYIVNTICTAQPYSVYALTTPRPASAPSLGRRRQRWACGSNWLCCCGGGGRREVRRSFLRLLREAPVWLLWASVRLRAFCDLTWHGGQAVASSTLIPEPRPQGLVKHRQGGVWLSVMIIDAHKVCFLTLEDTQVCLLHCINIIVVTDTYSITLIL